MLGKILKDCIHASESSYGGAVVMDAFGPSLEENVQCGLRIAISIILASELIGCGSQQRDVGHESVSYHPGYHFITFGPSIYGLVGAAKKEAVTICVTGVSADTLPKWTAWITDSVQKWLKPMRQWTADSIAPQVAVVTNNQNCDATFRIVAGQWGYAQISNRPVITVGPQVPFGVVIHEFGHAFGLSDTYQNGQSGNCRPGQPQSMMCNISFSDLQPDDVAGLKVVFDRRFPNDEPPPPNLPPSDPTDPIDPPVPSDPQDPIEQEDFAFMALEPSVTKDHYFLNFSLDEAMPAGKVNYCVGSMPACADPSAVWLSLSLHKRERSRQFFRSYESLGLANNTVITLKYSGATDLKQAFTMKRLSVLPEEVK